MTSFDPKPRSELNKSKNNIYVKDFPIAWTEEILREKFGAYGEISSLIRMEKEGKEGGVKPFAFICYNRVGDLVYGPSSALNAITDLDGTIVEGQAIYVKPALTLTERIVQIVAQSNRYKNSKKKCNLFVKNLPENFNNEQLA